MNEQYQSSFVKALADRWELWQPLIKDSIGKMPIMPRTMIHSLLDTFDIIKRMPELLEKLDNDEAIRRMIEGEVRALAESIMEPIVVEEVAPREEFAEEVAPPIEAVESPFAPGTIRPEVEELPQAEQVVEEVKAEAEFVEEAAPPEAKESEEEKEAVEVVPDNILIEQIKEVVKTAPPKRKRRKG